jgi:hypothetical protein
MAMLATEETRYPKPKRRLRLGFVGGGRGALVGEWHATGARLSNRWEIVAGALSSDPETARVSGEDWMLPPDRIYSDYETMAWRRLPGRTASTRSSSAHRTSCTFLKPKRSSMPGSTSSATSR